MRENTVCVCVATSVTSYFLSFSLSDFLDTKCSTFSRPHFSFTLSQKCVVGLAKKKMLLFVAVWLERERGREDNRGVVRRST